MKRVLIHRKLTVAYLMFAILIVPIAAIAQTQVTMPKNKYKVQDDVKIGSQAATEVEKQFPILSDADATRYIERVGARLVTAIPPQFRQTSFDYRFKLVNASDINAFALPGGPMYVNRGMIEAARNEGEMAGVMAHEISHVALRHATAQQTKQGSLGNQIGMIGMILGGAILAGEAGAQLGMLGAAAWMTKFSREYETQADVLGARIMADAGYDPRDLANMFKTIAAQGGGSGPEWLSSHPDPGNRFEKINKEATFLNVSPNPIKLTRDFERVQARLKAMPKARTMAEIQKQAEANSNPTANGKYSANVAYPSARVRTYSGANWLRLNVPSNWREFPSDDSVQFAPDGAFGSQGITHGAMVGVNKSQNPNLNNSTQEYVNGVLQANAYLRQRGNYERTYVAGRQGYSTVLAGRSPVTNRIEVVTVYTTQLRSGDLFYVITVVPEGDAGSYSTAFRNMLGSIRLSD